jgi:hypothetical protein
MEDNMQLTETSNRPEQSIQVKAQAMDSLMVEVSHTAFAILANYLISQFPEVDEMALLNIIQSNLSIGVRVTDDSKNSSVCLAFLFNDQQNNPFYQSLNNTFFMDLTEFFKITYTNDELYKYNPVLNNSLSYQTNKTVLMSIINRLFVNSPIVLPKNQNIGQQISIQ